MSIPPARSFHVLVVDDEEPVRRVVRRMLERHGHRVHDAADGVAALALIRDARDPFDVIVSDLRMPGMGGDDLLARLRAEGDPLQHRLAFLTGDTASADAMRQLTGATVPILAKPIAMSELARVVHELGEVIRSGR